MTDKSLQFTFSTLITILQNFQLKSMEVKRTIIFLKTNLLLLLQLLLLLYDTNMRQLYIQQLKREEKLKKRTRRGLRQG